MASPSVSGCSRTNAFTDGFRQGDGVFGNRVVVSPEHLLVVGIGADERDARIRIEGQDRVAVLQQHDGLFGHPAGQGDVRGAFYNVVLQVVPKTIVAVQLAQADAGGQQADQRAVHVSFVEQSGADGFRNGDI